MTSWEGFEPPTDGLEGHCSIQLSYQDIIFLTQELLYLIKVFKSIPFIIISVMIFHFRSCIALIMTSISLFSSREQLGMPKCQESVRYTTGMHRTL